MFGRKPAVVWHDDKLGETLSMFRNERAHMALVRTVVEAADGVCCALLEADKMLCLVLFLG